MKKTMLCLVCVVLAATAANGAEKPKTELEMGPGVGVTIYNSGFALVKERRLLELKKGVQTIRFDGVARAIDPASVLFESLTDPKSVTILEQNYEFDLVNANAILNKYLGKKIAVVLAGSGADHAQAVSGFLKSFGKNAYGQIVLASKADGGSIQIINRKDVRNITCSELPEGLLTKPTLVWQVASKAAGKHLCKITYLTANLSWDCTYTAVIAKNDTLALSGWVTINNRSGARYENAGVKLIAGDIAAPKFRGRSGRRHPRRFGRKSVTRIRRPKHAQKASPTEFSDHHLYKLPGPATINEKQVKQMELIKPAGSVAAKRLLLYEPGDKRVNVIVEFANTQPNGLGVAMPEGTVRVYERDGADGSLEFVGEDEVAHTPRGEMLSLRIGKAFDVVGETKQTVYERGFDWAELEEQVELRNHKAEPVEIRVRTWLGYNWRFLKSQLDDKPAEWRKVDGARVEWTIIVPAGGKRKLVYRVRYSRNPRVNP